jgi:hypothetical protein
MGVMMAPRHVLGEFSFDLFLHVDCYVNKNQPAISGDDQCLSNDVVYIIGRAQYAAYGVVILVPDLGLFARLAHRL